jgi:hypothetical protein
MPQFSRFTETYTSFSGADIVCSFAGTAIGTLSGITWSITREKAPIYTMGSANPRSFSRGKRGIAGSLIFTTFDRPALYQMIVDHIDDESILYYTRVSNLLPGLGGNLHRGIVPVPTAENAPAAGEYLDVVASLPYYNDQIPPFDVTITFANEYGNAAVKSIYGVEILNEGSGASMDDVVIEETMTFVAREVGPMVATKVNGQGGEDFTVIDEGFNLSTVFTP